MAYTAEILTSAIVVVGRFNPAIFSPDWLERNGLIGKDDADAARDGGQDQSLLVSHQVTGFETEWFVLQVLENRFSLTSKGALSPAFKDLAVGTLQLVPHTPVTAVGLNFLGDFKMASEDDYHRVGDVLAPKDVWKALYPDEYAGLASLTVRIQRGSRQLVEAKDEKRIAVQPSARIKFGVLISYNDHHDVTIDNDDGLRPAERSADIIDKQWDASWQDALRVFDGILSKTLVN